jgi:hypothetical protein
LTEKFRIDCIAMKRKAALQIHEELKGLSYEQRIAYWESVLRDMKGRRAGHKRKSRRAKRSD